MKNGIKIVLTLVILAVAVQSQSWALTAQFDISDRIKTQRVYLDSYDALFGQKEYSLEKSFFEMVEGLDKSKRKQVEQLVEKLDAYLTTRILMPAIYWRAIKKDVQKEQQVLAYYMLYRLTILRDVIDSPTNSDSLKESAKEALSVISGKNDLSTDSIYARMYDLVVLKAEGLARTSNDEEFVAKLAEEKLISFALPDDVVMAGDFSLSAFGFIPGNKVDLISKNDRSMERIEWLNKRVIFNGGIFDMDLPYIKMPTTEDPEGHIAFQQDPIFMKIREMIDAAQESIFIDIFLFGGTMGATLAEYLIDQTLLKNKRNPNFKTLLLHDYATDYNMRPEMLPIFHYIRDRIKNEPEVAACMMMIQANIQRHPPGIPFGLTNLIPKTEETFKFMEKRSTYYESKIDHSKVVVIDANGDHPAAYFGSKNWSDHSGAYYYDDAIYVEGPGAALVQASYYDDLDAALTLDKKERAWFYFKEVGLGNDHYLDRREAILEWFKIKRANYPFVGDQTIRLAEANVDGRIKNARNILLEMIAHAEDHIYMEELFIYDKYINDALIKRKMQNPDLQILIIADHNGNFGMNGLPNTIFMSDLYKHGIELRARRTYGLTAVFPNGKTQEYHQENHRKICSVDGKILLGGSSNLNPDTLQGSFREFGAQIFDEEVVGNFEENFIASWNDPEQVEILDVENMQLKIGGKLFSKESSRVVNGALSHVLRSKDDIEKRHK